MSKLEFKEVISVLTKRKEYFCQIDGEIIYAERIEIDGNVIKTDSGEYVIESSYTLHDGVLKATSQKVVTSDVVAQYIKPPLGVKPCYVSAYGRIGDLADGIKRQLSSDKPDTDLIKRWAVEIACQCDVISYDKIFEDKKMK